MCSFRRIDSTASVTLTPVPEVQSEEHSEAATAIQHPQDSLCAVSSQRCLPNIIGEIGPRLLLISYRKCHVAVTNHIKIIKSFTLCTFHIQ